MPEQEVWNMGLLFRQFRGATNTRPEGTASRAGGLAPDFVKAAIRGK
jgi:hypothetical protein